MSQYQHLLLAINIYENCDALFEEAKRLQNLYQARLSIIHVTPHITSLPYADEFEHTMKEQEHQRLLELKIKYKLENDEIFTSEGNPKREITSLAEKINADLIITGSHGRHGLELALGSTANGILHLARCDVLTLRLNDEGQHLVAPPYKNILWATDLQGDNSTVMQVAKAITTQDKATLHAIYVVADVASLGYYPTIEIDLKSLAEEKLKALINKENIPVAPDQAKVEIGFPKQEILEFAQQINADLIVVGSHGRSGLGAALLGSTANSILHGAKCDVLVVRV
jgi:nucleotide-binding universal stress UspA family protein